MAEIGNRPSRWEGDPDALAKSFMTGASAAADRDSVITSKGPEKRAIIFNIPVADILKKMGKESLLSVPVGIGAGIAVGTMGLGAAAGVASSGLSGAAKEGLKEHGRQTVEKWARIRREKGVNRLWNPYDLARGFLNPDEKRKLGVAIGRGAIKGFAFGWAGGAVGGAIGGALAETAVGHAAGTVAENVRGFAGGTAEAVKSWKESWEMPTLRPSAPSADLDEIVRKYSEHLEFPDLSKDKSGMAPPEAVRANAVLRQPEMQQVLRETFKSYLPSIEGSGVSAGGIPSEQLLASLVRDQYYEYIMATDSGLEDKDVIVNAVKERMDQDLSSRGIQLIVPTPTPIVVPPTNTPTPTSTFTPTETAIPTLPPTPAPTETVVPTLPTETATPPATAVPPTPTESPTPIPQVVPEPVLPVHEPIEQASAPVVPEPVVQPSVPEPAPAASPPSPAPAPEPTIQPPAPVESIPAPEASQLNGAVGGEFTSSVAEKIANIPPEVFLEKGSNPWVVASKTLEQVLGRPPTNAEILELTKAIVKESQIAVPSWGIGGVGFVESTNLPSGYKLVFNESVKSVIRSLASK